MFYPWKQLETKKHHLFHNSTCWSCNKLQFFSRLSWIDSPKQKSPKGRPANWVIIWYLPPIEGTRKLHWLKNRIFCLLLSVQKKQIAGGIKTDVLTAVTRIFWRSIVMVAAFVPKSCFLAPGQCWCWIYLDIFKFLWIVLVYQIIRSF